MTAPDAVVEAVAHIEKLLQAELEKANEHCRGAPPAQVSQIRWDYELRTEPMRRQLAALKKAAAYQHATRER